LAVAGVVEAAIEPDSTVVCLVSGGNNDVSRYREVLERSLVHLGLKHYFLVDFPQEPGVLRRFLDGVLGPTDDITLFEYVKRNNRETGEALVGIELGSAADLDGLLERMRAIDIHVETLEPGSPAYRYLL
jgi:threonine dehydratase